MQTSSSFSSRCIIHNGTTVAPARCVRDRYTVQFRVGLIIIIIT